MIIYHLLLISLVFSNAPLPPPVTPSSTLTDQSKPQPKVLTNEAEGYSSVVLTNEAKGYSSVVLTGKSKGYSSVNKLSLLPDEIRTTENLEGDVLPLDSEKELQQYQKERADYEEKQLQEMKAKKLGTSSQSSGMVVPLSSSPEKKVVAGYEDIDPLDFIGTKQESAATSAPTDEPPKRVIDPYEDPADAVKRNLTGIMKTPLQQEKKMNIAPVTVRNQKYTPVFNVLPESHMGRSVLSEGHTGRVPQVSNGKTSSDNSPNGSPKQSASQIQPIPKYENKPGQSNAGSVKSENELFWSQEGIRQSKRSAAAKEVVEFNPDKQKFRMTSMKKKKKQEGNGTDGGTLEVSGGARAIQTSGEEPAVIMDNLEAKGARTYSIVNMSDKRKNRMKSDISKCEGSGVPQRYNMVPAVSS